jgi:hypothetical protein
LHYTYIKGDGFTSFPIPLVGLKPALEMVTRLATESFHEFYHLPKSNQIITCVHCGAIGLTGTQGNHACQGVYGEMEKAGQSVERERFEKRDDNGPDHRSKAPRTLKRMKRSKDAKFGVLVTQLLFAHELFRYPDLITELTAYSLADVGLAWIDPNPILNQADHIGQYSLLLPPATRVPDILVHNESSKDFILTTGVARMIESAWRRKTGLGMQGTGR